MKDKKEFKKKEAILDLEKFKDKKVHVTFQGGRQVEGTLLGFDLLQNLVLDDVIMGEQKLGLVVCRGTLIVTISPLLVSIPNPF